MSKTTAADAKLENFADLLAESFAQDTAIEGSVVKGQVVEVTDDYVTIDVGLKSEGRVPLREFAAPGQDAEIQAGDSVEVYVERMEDRDGAAMLSREKARREEAWIILENAFEAQERVTGVIFGRVKGGFTVDLSGATAFLPGSQVDIRPINDIGPLMGTPQPFQILKIDRRRGNIVVSRRSVLEESRAEARSELVSNLQEGQVLQGVVKNITDYGAFVDLGGVDGLLHITDIAWKRVKHPSEMISVGEELTVKILKFDREKNRVSLGLKQLGADPWANIASRYQHQSRVYGTVTNIADYGCFVELEEGVEGLVHMSELDWTNKNIHPSKIVQPGDKIEVMILEVDQDRRRISLGIKQCRENPWQDFASKHQEGDRVKGNIRSMTDFGVFIGLDGNIDGLIHLSDLSWTDSGEDIVRTLAKGQEIEAIILTIDAERERISLGVKQLESDPLSDYIMSVGENAVVSAPVKSLTEKQAVLQLTDTIDGVLRIADYAVEHTDSLLNELKEGQEVEVRLMYIDKKSHQLIVSRKAMFEDATMSSDAGSKAPKATAPTKTTLGDLLKEQMQKKDN